MIALLEKLLGPPVVLEELKRKPGRRRTLRATGARRGAIVKVYESDRAPVVAQRVAALANGPPEPRTPELICVDPSRRLVVLSEVPGPPLREALLGGDLAVCRRVGAALGRWHRTWRGAAPVALRRHTPGREAETLLARAGNCDGDLARRVRSALPSLTCAWECSTVVHRDLYEEQILVGERVGLIDLDDAAAGPPELDLGNLLGHVELLGIRARRDLQQATDELLRSYAAEGLALDVDLLCRCRGLTLLRLACLNDDPELVERAISESVASR